MSDSGFFSKFYARRTLRIFPLYYGVLFALMLLTPWPGIQWHGMNWMLLFYLQNTSASFYQFQPGAGLSVGHFWSLAIEEQFYLVWPLAVFFISDKKRLLCTCLALSCASLVLRAFLAFHHTSYPIINGNTLCRADSLLIGAALALLLRTRLHDSVLRSSRAVFLAVVAIVASLNLARIVVEGRPDWLLAFDRSYLSVRYTLMAVASAALIAWCLRPSMLRRCFETRILRFFGKYSYGLYILHFVALGFLIKTFRGWIALVTPSKLAGVGGAGLLSLLVALLAAYASYNVYEKQFLRLKRNFDYDRRARSKVLQSKAT